MKTVSNSSVLISLGKIGRTSILRDKFGKILIPPAVWREVVEEGGERPGAREVAESDWIEVAEEVGGDIKSILTMELDEGEAEAIALAKSIGAGRILIDEKIGRIYAEEHGLVVIGTLGLLVLGKRNGLVSSVRDEIEKLILSKGFRVSDELIKEVLLQVGEE